MIEEKLERGLRPSAISNLKKWYMLVCNVPCAVVNFHKATLTLAMLSNVEWTKSFRITTSTGWIPTVPVPSSLMAFGVISLRLWRLWRPVSKNYLLLFREFISYGKIMGSRMIRNWTVKPLTRAMIAIATGSLEAYRAMVTVSLLLAWRLDVF